MIYEYSDKVVNNGKDFFDNSNFVGYILPNGNIYACKNHNVTNVETFLKMYLELLDKEYENKDELLMVETEDELAKIVLNRLKKMSHDEVHALLDFIKDDIILSDILVGFFGCHMITRLKKRIITSEINHRCFYNYLLHGFKINTIYRIVYDEKNKKYYRVTKEDRNDYLYDEIKTILDDIGDEDISLFHK